MIDDGSAGACHAGIEELGGALETCNTEGRAHPAQSAGVAQQSQRLETGFGEAAARKVPGLEDVGDIAQCPELCSIFCLFWRCFFEFHNFHIIVEYLNFYYFRNSRLGIVRIS